MEPKLLLSALIGALLAFLSTSVAKWVEMLMQRRMRIGIERKLVMAELMDIRRHCLSNLDALTRIDLELGVPSVIHFRKLKIIESSVLFSSETFRNINTAHSPLIYRLRIVVNNLNVEADAIIEYLSAGKIDQVVLQGYLNYIQEKLAYTNDRLTYELENMGRRTKPKYQGFKRPKYIVYASLKESVHGLEGRAPGASYVPKPDRFLQYLRRNKGIYKDVNDND